MSKLSMKDIARMSGVSIATVSRVINNKGKYSEETKKKVLKVINESGYNINSHAKSLRTNISNTIGVIVPDIINPFFSILVQKIEILLYQYDYSTIICNTNRNVEKEKKYLKTLESNNVDALIVISGDRDKGFSFDNKITNIPYICIDRKPANFSETVYISSDHYNGAINATNLLISNGSLKPIIVLKKYLSISSKTRLDGFKRALEDNGIVFKDEMIFYINELNFEENLVNKIKSGKIDSIFCVNDDIALKLISILNRSNISIPEEVQIIGFDGIDFGGLISPSLSTVKQDIEKIAQISIEKLFELINNKVVLGQTILIPTELIKRDSTL